MPRRRVPVPVALPALLALLLVASRAHAQEGLTLEQAIRGAWAGHPALLAGDADVEAKQAQASAAGAALLPSLTLDARALRTDQPVGAFGLLLDQGRITQQDFDPARLNDPAAVYAWGLGATLRQPLYAGGRLGAGRRATQLDARAAEQDQARRRQELALHVTQAYLGAQLAEQGVRWAEDQLAQARETEAFVRARVAQGALLQSEALRATAFRAQAEAQRASAQQQLASARSGLVMLVGDAARDTALLTPVAEGGGTVPVEDGPAPDTALRPDLEAARARAGAARAGADAARGRLLPDVFLQVSAETLRRKPDEGTVWTTALVAARWELSAGAVHERRAASARAHAASEAARWQERQAAREVEDARTAVQAAAARALAAQEALAAGEAVRAQRTARHRQGLLPLTEVLDAEAGLTAARTLLLESQLDARLARARLQLALGEPVEGVKP